jgi:4a-hydroxytetrahydrobiopterin dehydratase
MRASWDTTRDDYLHDALTLLDGWTRHDRELTRTLPIDDSQHAALTERIQVAADALQCRPEIRRIDGQTRIRVSTPDSASLTDGAVALAARIETAYRTVTGQLGNASTPLP